MTEFKNTAKQLWDFRLRVTTAGLFVFICFALLIARFVYLQVWHYRQYALQANENRISVAPITPSRGLITDRNGVVLARNYFAYTLEITPSKIHGKLDDVIAEIGQVIRIEPPDLRRFKKFLEESKNFESLPIRIRLSDEEVAHFASQNFRFPGVAVRARMFRQYPLGEHAAHVIGYIGRISTRDQEQIKELAQQNEMASDRYDPRLRANNYKGTDYIGKIGIEQSYEMELHGATGFEEVEVTAGGRPVPSLSRRQPTPGNNLMLALDINLQQIAEKAFAGKRGALVAIEPATGDVLAFVSAPSFDPNLFVDGIDQQAWDNLNNSPNKPLLNRPLRGAYPPGSTYKPFMALAALTSHRRTPQWSFVDPGYYTVAKHVFRDDVRTGHGRVDLYQSIVVSCDTYYYMLAHEMGVNAIASFMKPWGFGQITGIDIKGEATGVLPSTEWKKKTYHTQESQRWYDGETISIGIGQGYNSFTMLQLAHAMATLANNGVVMKPHLVKKIEHPLTHETRLTVPHASAKLDVSQAHIDFVKRAMVGVVQTGTGAMAFKGAMYPVGAKTGTAQVFSLRGGKYRAHAIAENRRDHALVIAFGSIPPGTKINGKPVQTKKTGADSVPEIALALIVENGGWGAQAAAPIARKLLDYYLVDRFQSNAPSAPVAAPSTPQPEFFVPQAPSH